MTRKAPRPKPPTFRSCLECGGQSTGLLCDRCSHRVETPCLRCKINNAGPTGVCEPCFDAWLERNEDTFMHPYGAIDGFADPLIPPELEPEPEPEPLDRSKNIGKCRFCGRLWNPPVGETPLHFCRACSKERRALAHEKHVQRYQRRKERQQAASEGWQAITVVAPLPAPQWPAPRTINQQMPNEGPMLIWVDGMNEWRSGCMCIASDDPDFPLPLAQRLYYTIDGDRTERGYDLTPELIWLPLPPAPEVQHAK